MIQSIFCTKVFHFGMALCFFCLISQNIMAKSTPLSGRIANYKMSIELDPNLKLLTGKTQLNWKNPSSDTVRTLQFHLYWNAFRNASSTMYKESNNGFERMQNNCDWGWSVIKKFSDASGNALNLTQQYIQPDDDNTADKTVVEVVLSKPVLPNDSLEIHFDWEAKIPRFVARTGYNRDYYFLAQWFPKLGVYEPAGMRDATKGAWNCHQYHSSGEFYADFGVYEVSLTTPQDFVVGASGILTSEVIRDSIKTSTFLAEDVIDFSWTASPHFVVQEEKWQSVNLKLLSYPEHQGYAERYFKSIKYGMTYMDEHLGKYPYPTLTIVSQPYHGLFSAAMEYPMLVTAPTFRIFPEGIRTTENLTIHEFVHQYFMQMIATHEQEESWMDEGMTTYFEGRILDQFFTNKTSVVKVGPIKVGNVESNRIGYVCMDNPSIASLNTNSWEMKNNSYHDLAYYKTATWLRTLEGLVGLETMDAIMKTYFERWKFKHPNGQDFVAIANEIISKRHGTEFGQNMDWFFEPMINGTATCDYELSMVSNHPATDQVGFYEATEDCETLIPSAYEYDSKVQVQRLGEVIMPQEILITFENGDTTLTKWDGKDRAFEVHFKGNQKVVSAVVDPYQKIYIDTNFLNNSYQTNRTKTTFWSYISQTMWGLQQFFQTLSGLF